MPQSVHVEGDDLHAELWVERADGVKLKLRDARPDERDFDLSDARFIVVKVKP